MTAPPSLRDAPGASDAEPARDAWLREALRHAPDARVEAPPALSAAILREARAAVASPRRVGAASSNRWSAAWAWLARPSVATGFASLMVAGFVGLLWRERPIDPLPAEPAPALRRADSSPAAVVPASAPAAPAAPLAPQGGAVRMEAPPLAPAQRPPAPRVAPAQKSEVAPAAPPRAAAAKEVAQPALPPSPAPAEPAAPPVAAAAETARDMSARAELRMRSDPAAATADAAGATSKSAEAPAVQGRLTELRRMAPAAAAPIPAVADRLRALRSRIGDEPGRWVWQLDAGARRPVDAALLDWLARLERALVPGQAAAAGAGPVLTLWRDDQRAGRIALHLATATMALDDAPARLDPAAMGSLQAALADLAR